MEKSVMDPEEPLNLQSLTLKELKEVAKALFLKAGNMRKSELIECILAIKRQDYRELQRIKRECKLRKRKSGVGQSQEMAEDSFLALPLLPLPPSLLKTTIGNGSGTTFIMKDEMTKYLGPNWREFQPVQVVEVNPINLPFDDSTELQHFLPDKEVKSCSEEPNDAQAESLQKDANSEEVEHIVVEVDFEEKPPKCMYVEMVPPPAEMQTKPSVSRCSKLDRSQFEDLDCMAKYLDNAKYVTFKKKRT